MLRFFLSFFLCHFLIFTFAQKKKKLSLSQKDVMTVLDNIRDNYIYLPSKSIDLTCLQREYSKKAKSVKTQSEKILFYEMLLNEFYDEHLILNTNIKSSYRLYSPVYAETKDNKTIITDVWLSQIKTLPYNLIGAHILQFNGVPFNTVIDQFPTVCQDKTEKETRNWITNKILSGKYNAPRKLQIELTNGKRISINLDRITLKKHKTLLDTSIKDSIGIIRIHNSLGNENLIPEFEKAIHNTKDTKGIILDLRNTISGGRCAIGATILGHFIGETTEYQKISYDSSRHPNLNPDLNCMYTVAIKDPFLKPMVVLVGKWTGSMGEGIAMGIDGIQRGIVMGTEMRKLLGGMYGYSIPNSTIQYSISMEKTNHVDGSSRKVFQPTIVINNIDNKTDLVFKAALEHLNKTQ